tara:strand:- start:729 stop:1013 length:285 start_codon:yes stop_codon:yes gene_type:complete
MNVSELREQMLKRSCEWEALYTKDGARVGVGDSIRAWLSIVDSLTSKLVNPRKDEYHILESQMDSLKDELSYLRKQLKKNHTSPDVDPNIRRNY